MNLYIFSSWFGPQRVSKLVTAKTSFISCLVSISGYVATDVLLRFYPGPIPGDTNTTLSRIYHNRIYYINETNFKCRAG